MLLAVLLFAVPVLFIAWQVARPWLVERRRSRIRARPLPAPWWRILRSLPLYRTLPPDLQRQLREHVQVFLDEKDFVGCREQEITDEVRVTIAAQACLLLLHRETDYYPRLRAILVYPTGYIAEREQRAESGIWEDRDEHLLGHTGQRLRAMVLAWDAVRHGAREPTDGKNLVFHEFAHQLDFLLLTDADDASAASPD